MPAGRPVTDVGTAGAIHTKAVRSGVYRARVRVRDLDGVRREVTATGTTKAAAERALRRKLNDRHPAASTSVTRETTLRTLAQEWLKFLRDEGRIESSTTNEYERVLDKVILPALGSLRLRELSTGQLERFLVDLRAVSSSRQHKAKVVLSAVLGMAVRYDALLVNPVQQTSRLHREKASTRSLTASELREVGAALRRWEEQQRPGPRASADMRDIVDLMLATGARIGEILALRWCEVDLDAQPPRLTITGTIKTETGKGTFRKDSPKTDASVRTLALPVFGVAVLRRRLRERQDNLVDAVFPTRNGTWQQVTNVERRWRQIRKGSAVEWATPHTFRKTVATLIAERVGAETASQQLGHASPDVTREFYIAKPAIAADVAHVLDELDRS